MTYVVLLVLFHLGHFRLEFISSNIAMYLTMLYGVCIVVPIYKSNMKMVKQLGGSLQLFVLLFVC